MQKVRNLIVAHKASYPEFGQYLKHVARIQSTVTRDPDDCIATCKALIEGVAKSAVIRLETGAQAKQVDTEKFPLLVRRALTLMRENDDVVEDAFMNRAVSLCQAIGEFRNTRSDLAHGRNVPKVVESHYSLSELVMPIAEAIVVYMLGAIFVLHRTEIEADSENGEDRLIYEEQVAFNAFLDETYPLVGKPLYSLALYQQFYEDYRVQHAEFTNEEE